VFALALLARLGFLFLADQPLLYTHQYTYFTNGLRIAEHPSPWRYVLTSDEWRTWDGHWTIAPLYHLFLAAVFRLGGPHLLLVRLLQCALDAAAAVAVASLGRRAAGPRGVWAGVAYALYWPALEMPTWTLTENLHTPLFTAALAVLAGEAARPSRGRAFLGGALLGLSALARSVSSGFVGVAALWRLWAGGGRRAWPAAALVAAGGAAMILPWTARNVFLAGDAVLIESAAFENIWWANHFTDRARYLRQEEVVHGQPTPAAKRAAALHFALRGIRRSPGDFVQKVRTNFWHFVRPEGLQNLFGVQRSLEPWRHAGTLLLDDLPLLLAIPPFVSFLAAGRPSPARGLIALWTAYYLFMVVVLFHNEIRYRSAFVPFLFAGAVAGLSPPDPAGRRRLVHWAALGLGAAISIGAAWPYGVHVWGALRSIPAMRRAQAAVQRGDLERAAAETADAAARDPRSARPWLDLGKALAWAGRPFEAAQAYEREAGRVNFANWRPALGLQAARGVTGPPEEEARLRQRLDRASWDMDPWLLLESAWREVPPPRADACIHVAWIRPSTRTGGSGTATTSWAARSLPRGRIVGRGATPGSAWCPRSRPPRTRSRSRWARHSPRPCGPRTSRCAWGPAVPSEWSWTTRSVRIVSRDRPRGGRSCWPSARPRGAARASRRTRASASTASPYGLYRDGRCERRLAWCINVVPPVAR
jgi:hypothetical protein